MLARFWQLAINDISSKMAILKKKKKKNNRQRQEKYEKTGKNKKK